MMCESRGSDTTKPDSPPPATNQSAGPTAPQSVRVSIDLAEVPGALTKPAIIVYPRPMLPGVIGTVKTAFLRLDNCVDAIGIGSGNGNADLAEDSSGKSVAFEMFPSNAVVLRAIQ